MRRRHVVGGLALALALAAWLPALALLFRGDPAAYLSVRSLSPAARALLDRQTALWSDPRHLSAERERMRAGNPEWDFMARTFLVLALGSAAAIEPGRAPAALRTMRHLVDDTLALERERGMHHFLLPYARERPFVDPAGRSLFLDGEIALMLGALQLSGPDASHEILLRERVAAVAEALARSPIRAAESYPDEGWIFCNAVALAALAVADRALGTDHRALVAECLAAWRARLVDPRTGILVSSFHADGRHRDGPEGSSIFLAAHCLAFVDPALAREQYGRAAAELSRSCLGFGYAAEWPRSWRGAPDIDSGSVLPVLDLSPAASGFALLAAATFEDDARLAPLLASLALGAFPDRDGTGLRYLASNAVGDAVILYGSVARGLIDRVQGGTKR